MEQQKTPHAGSAQLLRGANNKRPRWIIQAPSKCDTHKTSLWDALLQRKTNATNTLSIDFPYYWLVFMLFVLLSLLHLRLAVSLPPSPSFSNILVEAACYHNSLAPPHHPPRPPKKTIGCLVVFSHTIWISCSRWDYLSCLPSTQTVLRNLSSRSACAKAFCPLWGLPVYTSSPWACFSSEVLSVLFAFASKPICVVSAAA